MEIKSMTRAPMERGLTHPSIINKSFEKKPHKKNIPIKFRALKITQQEATSLLPLYFNISRPSWEDPALCKKIPTPMNNILLKNAWENKWKKHRPVFLLPANNINNPICDKVE